jgi:hypothetical protein
MRFVRCGSRLFKPDHVTAVDLCAEADVVKVVVAGVPLFFRGPEAEAVRAFFSRIPATDLDSTSGRRTGSTSTGRGRARSSCR